MVWDGWRRLNGGQSTALRGQAGVARRFRVEDGRTTATPTPAVEADGQHDDGGDGGHRNSDDHLTTLA